MFDKCSSCGNEFKTEELIDGICDICFDKQEDNDDDDDNDNDED